MKVTITGHHMEVTPAIRDHVEDKMGRVNRHFDDLLDINVILTVEKLNHNAEATVHVNGRDFFVHTSQSDMYAAIDELTHLLDRQIIKHKERQNEGRHGQPLKHLANGA